jgi:hypothetical protein
MKKRSLVSAIVMLVVSALLLSTATYAWFASNQAVSVGTVTGKVSSSDGSISISADNSTWKAAIDVDDLKYTGNPNNFADTLQPKSFKAGSFFDGTSGDDGVSFQATADTNTNFIRYQFYLKSSMDNTSCTITPTVNTSNFVYVAILADGQYYYYSSDNGSYYPIIATGTATDGNGNAIIDEAEGTTMVDDTAIEASSSGNISITLNQAAKTVTVWMWAEGQDAQCIGGSEASTNTVSLTIQKNQTTVTGD